MKRDYLEAVFVLVTLAVFILAFALPMSNAQPFGTTPTELQSTQAPEDAAGSDDAIAGNVTEMSIDGITRSRAWQGYYGNVTGTIVLADSGDNVLYDWSVANPRGEVFASRNDSVTWTEITCFNYTATGSGADDSANAGGTSQFGLNITGLNSQFNIPDDSVYAPNFTFNETGANGHPLFYVGSLDFTLGECPSTRLYTNSAPGSDFDNALLYDHVSQQPVFASLIEYFGATGFDGGNHDFQMMVLDDRHGTNTATTTYYFYVELE